MDISTQNIIFISIAVAQIAVLVWYFINSRKKSRIAAERKEAIAREYPFEGMRNIALNTVPGAVLANVPDDQVFVYSVLMDWDMGTDIVTLVVQITGEANLYVRSGGGIIGAGRYLNISAAAQKFTSDAQNYLHLSHPAAGTSLPPKNAVQFFLLTNRGKFNMQDDMKNIENRTSALLPLFEAANNVIGEMRKTALTEQNAA